jgi:predicted AlkP superfamily phosphohydrolase/phosphomutase/Tfp pilus assembly protein PilF
MLRLRSVRLILTLAGLGLLLYILASLYMPSSRRMTFGVDKSNGHVRLVQNRVSFLPWHQYYVLSFEKRGGSAQRDGAVRIQSKEGVPVTITYRLRFSFASDQLTDARTLVNAGWSAWIRTRVGEAVSAVTQQVPIEELLSPTSQFSRRREVLRQTVAGHLGRSGLNVTAFEIARIEADREALLTYKRAELRRSARGVAGRVAIFAIDGADWELLSELADDERIPNLAALARGGTTASLQTIQPTVSPLVWTTMATGVTPDRHGVLDFMDHARKAPVDANTRRAPAVWDIAEAFGRQSIVVNWWTAWPPLPDHTTVFDTPVTLAAAAVHPEQLAGRVRQLEVPANTIGYDQVRRFLNITGAEYQRSVESNNPNDPVNVMRGVLSKTWTDHRVAMNLYQEQQPLVFMMEFEGTDVVNHIGAPFHPPYREGISQEGYRRYWPTVANYYAEIDRLMGEWMKVITDDTTVLIVSAHGFRWGKNRPRTMAAGRAALSDHRNPGVFIAYGNHVAASRGNHSMSLYDITPTILAILGLPQSTDMPGHVATWALRDIQPVETVRVVSYSEFFGERPISTGAGADVQQFQRVLQAVGHLPDPTRAAQPVFEDEDGTPAQTATAQIPPEQWGPYAWWNNQGIELRKQNKLKEATEAFQKAIDLNPNRPTAYLNMAMTLFDRQQYTAADEVFIMAVQRGLPNADRWFIDFAALYRSRNMTSRAIALLYKAKSVLPQSPMIAANLGSALAQAERYTEGLPELERALGLQPSSTLALNNLGTFYAKKEDYGRALDFWNRSLAIDARQPQIRAASEAARTHL